MSIMTQNEFSDVNETVKLVNELMIRAASKFLVTKGYKKKTKNNIRYNRSCCKLRREVK